MIGGVRVKQSTDGAVNVHVVSKRPGSAAVGLAGGGGGSVGGQITAENPSASGAVGASSSSNGSGSATSSASSSCGSAGRNASLIGASVQSSAIPGAEAGSIGGQRVSLTVMPNGDINLKRGDDLTGESFDIS